MALLNPRALKEARNQAQSQVNRIKSAYSVSRLKSWPDLATMLGMSVPNTFTEQPFTYSNLSKFCMYWTQSFEARLAAATEPDAVQPKVKTDKNVDTFHEVTMYPEQQGCYKALYEHFFTAKQQAALQDGYTGSGKSFIGGACIAKAIQDGLLKQPDAAFRLHPFIIFCPKGVAESWRRVIESMGLGDLLRKRKIYVFSDSEFNTDSAKMFVDEHENLNTGDITLVWNPLMVPLFAIVDECHRYVNPKTHRYKCMQALIESKPRKSLLFMSATPAEKVNDLQLFTIAANIDFMGQRVTKDTFKLFAGVLDATPDKPNREALKRARKVLQSHIFSIPYIKPKYKAINVVQLVDFQTPAHYNIYQSAHQRYIEACLKSGKNTMWGRFEKFIALNNYRKTVEPLRAYWLAERAAANYKAGTFATAIGTAYKETITEAAFQLVDKYGIPRDKISIVWGGKREYKTEDLLTKDELDRILKSPDPTLMLKDRTLLKRVRITLRYLQDQHEHTETIEQQAYRHNRLKELRLVGKQSDNARQAEIDRYQSGESQILLFTNASGGIGLSFDRNREFLLPREGLFTPVYSGKEFQQVLGRLVRRASLSDATQRICMMRNTVEEHHVAPILDEKLKCIAEITNRNFDIIDLLSQSVPVTDAHVTVRDEEQAAVDAEKDNTIVTDLVKEDDEEDEDTDEDNEVI